MKTFRTLAEALDALRGSERRPAKRPAGSTVLLER
jgi:hypothetical protein